MPIKRTSAIFLCLILASAIWGQRGRIPAKRYVIDTLRTEEGVVLFLVRQYYDTTLAESYKCKFDSTDFSYRYGFLRHTKGYGREYKPIDIHDRKEYPWQEVYPGLRDHATEMRIIRWLR